MNTEQSRRWITQSPRRQTGSEVFTNLRFDDDDDDDFDFDDDD